MTDSRFAFIHDKDNLLLIVKPIGDMPGDVVAEKSSLPILALTRLGPIAESSICADIPVISETETEAASSRPGLKIRPASTTMPMLRCMHDPYERLRLPKISADFPHETICRFTDYHEAVGWHLAADRGQYLETLGDCPSQPAVTLPSAFTDWPEFIYVHSGFGPSGTRQRETPKFGDSGIN